MLWLCAYFPLLGLEVQARTALSGTALSGKEASPCVLLVDNRVVQCNQIAQQLDLRPGISLAAAHSIAPDLLHWQHDEQATAQHLEYLAQLLYRYSSLVSIDSQMNGYADNPGEQHHCVLLEISASLKLFNGLTKLVHRVARELCTLEHSVRLQVADTPLAAISGARWLNRTSPADKTGDRQIGKAALAPLALASLPLDCLPLTPRQGEKLHNMGLRHCGALLNVPRTELCQRFGRELGNHLARLTGELADPRTGIEPPRRFTRSLHLLDPCTSKQALRFPLQRLCREFERWLIAQQLGVSVLGWRLANHSGSDAEFEVRITQPTQTAAGLLSLTLLHLERIELPRDVLDIRLASNQLTGWNNQSDDLFPLLFDGGPSGALQKNTQQAQPATDLIDQIRARLGHESCSGVTVMGDHRPEFAWRRNDLSNVARSRNEQLATGAAGKGSRPLFLLPTPQRIPASRLRLLQGPERIHGGWWQRTLKRDYYIATRQGSTGRCWVFVDQQHRWYVHGYFA